MALVTDEVNSDPLSVTRCSNFPIGKIQWLTMAAATSAASLVKRGTRTVHLVRASTMLSTKWWSVMLRSGPTKSQWTRKFGLGGVDSGLSFVLLLVPSLSFLMKHCGHFSMWSLTSVANVGQ